MSPLPANELQRIFEKIDKNGDGRVSLEELKWLLERIGVQISLNELESLVGKTSLDFNEFVLFYDSISSKDDDDDVVVVEAFQVFDSNGDGFISCEELEGVLKKLGLWDEKNGRDCRNMIHVYDTNLDGMLDFEEFKNMMLLTIS